MTGPAKIDRIGLGTDIHRLGPNRPLILGHVPIEYDEGLIGHSDGDVLLHAIIDALAGAAGLPDIGEMFPDTDPTYKDADSGKLLRQVVKAVYERGYGIVNVDATIHTERPKLSPYKASIRDEVARLLGVSAEAVVIKAKTNEGLDAVGRGEAIAAMVVVGLHVV